MENSEEVNEEHLALVRALGLSGKTAMVWEVDTDGEPDGQTLHIIVVETENVILVSHGWGSSGAYVDVRCYVGLDDPQQVTPEVLELDRTVIVMNTFGDSRPQSEV